MTRVVGYLGPEGTFTHQAARVLEPNATHVPLSSSQEIIAAVDAGELDGGVIPIDNSIEGPVAPSIDAILSHEVIITAILGVPVAFTAFRSATAGDTPATVITSHPHALAQCHGFIVQQGLPTRVASSTAAACAEIADDEIALSASICGSLYDVVPIARDVQDSTSGLTRFAHVTTRRSAESLDEMDQADSTIVAIVPDSNGRGVLSRITTTFNDFDYDLQGLVLRPMRTVDFRYVFVFTVVAHPRDPKLATCLQTLIDEGDTVIVLGYFASEPARLPESEPTHLRSGASSPDQLAAQLFTGGGDDAVG